MSVDLLSLAGISHEFFLTSGEDVRIKDDNAPVARVFRQGSQVVYRAGTGIEWDDEDGHPVS